MVLVFPPLGSVLVWLYRLLLPLVGSRFTLSLAVRLSRVAYPLLEWVGDILRPYRL